MKKKYVYFVDEGGKEMRSLLGGKGANICEMTKIGFPVPQAFIITTEACIKYNELGNNFPEGLKEQIEEYLKKLEDVTGKKLGDPKNPLLISVRSGAPVSMPGMMDTVLNLGLNDESVKGLTNVTKNERFVYDSYRRFISMFGEIVMGIDGLIFEKTLGRIKKEKGYKYDTELTADDLKELIKRYREIIISKKGKEFPQEPLKQLEMSVKAVFNSFFTPRAVVYRKANDISEDMGTAVNVQTMVFGNLGWESGTGVAFTRDPATGEKVYYGEYLLNAQGEDVVAGIRTPKQLVKLKDDLPEIYEELTKLMDKLEEHYTDMQDLEFTIEPGKLYMLQTRTGKRTAAAALKIAVEMHREGLISKEEAVRRISPYQLDQLLHPRIDPTAELNILTKGLNASPGAAIGKVVFDADRAEELGKEGEKVILVRWETTPDDIHGVIESQGILTSHGGMTSHAAVVARGMGKPCVCGAEEIHIDYDKNKFDVGDITVREGDIITIDGTKGNVIIGEVPLIEPEINVDFLTLLEWCDEIRRLGVWANADTPEDAKKAREYGAEGIGLCRTEHMFMGEDRLQHVQKMILGKTEEERIEPLEKLLRMQKEDFVGIFKAMTGLPVIIRLLDPPLHEFLPDYVETLLELQKIRKEKTSVSEIKEKEELLMAIRVMQETNPMLGLRGCRLGITRPDVYEMQVKAIIEAACDVIDEGYEPVVEIMIPLVAHKNELKITREEAEKVIKEVLKRRGKDISYKIGTMIELPRAALTADEIAHYADFFSYGTNDLTQTTFGFSRDDAEPKFIPQYIDLKILEKNPFEVLDIKGVGKLVDMGCKLARQTNPDIELGICGEHGGDPKSIHFCHKVGLNYVSCSPFRVPIARLASAQAVIEEKNK